MTRPHAGGYSLVELIVLMAVLAIITAIGTPMYLGMRRSEEADGAAQQVVSTLNRARQLAITGGLPYSLEAQTTPNNRLRLCNGTTVPCPGGTTFTGGGTDASGWQTMDSFTRIVATSTISFNSLGAATASGTVRVQNSSQTACRDITVSPSGRIAVTVSASCP